MGAGSIEFKPYFNHRKLEANPLNLDITHIMCREA